jgi:hypothetical protein
MLEYMHKLLDKQDCDCARCERPLTDLPSKMRGYGPQCYGKMLDKVRSYGICVEAVEVPMHAICYLLYGEEDGMPEGAKESADEWMDENNYKEVIGLSYGYYHEMWMESEEYPGDVIAFEEENPFFDSHISNSVAFGPYWMSDCYYCDFTQRRDWDQQRWNEVFGTEQC